jgi:recombination protein RecA
VGNRTRVKVVKNKVSPPFKEVEFDILYGKGICKEGDLLDLGASLNVIEKSGTWYSYNGERLGQGRDAARDSLKANPKMLTEIREKVLRLKGVQNLGSMGLGVGLSKESGKEENVKSEKSETKAEKAALHPSNSAQHAKSGKKVQ